jgi:hypothetical protein
MRRDPVLALVGLPNCGKSTLFNRCSIPADVRVRVRSCVCGRACAVVRVRVRVSLTRPMVRQAGEDEQEPGHLGAWHHARSSLRLLRHRRPIGHGKSARDQRFGYDDDVSCGFGFAGEV